MTDFFHHQSRSSLKKREKSDSSHGLFSGLKRNNVDIFLLGQGERERGLHRVPKAPIFGTQCGAGTWMPCVPGGACRSRSRCGTAREREAKVGATTRFVFLHTSISSALATFASKPLVTLPWFVTPTPVPLRPQPAESYPPLGQCHRAAFPGGSRLISRTASDPAYLPPASRKSPFWGRFYPLSAAGD